MDRKKNYQNYIDQYIKGEIDIHRLNTITNAIIVRKIVKILIPTCIIFIGLYIPLNNLDFLFYNKYSTITLIALFINLFVGFIKIWKVLSTARNILDMAEDKKMEYTENYER